MGKYDKIWEMKQGGPHDSGVEIFKCTECQAETEPGNGWNGRPDLHNCKPGCPCRESKLRSRDNSASSYAEKLGAITKDCGCPMGSPCSHPSPYADACGGA